jgi:hypothetical protein
MICTFLVSCAHTVTYHFRTVVVVCMCVTVAGGYTRGASARPRGVVWYCARVYSRWEYEYAMSHPISVICVAVPVSRHFYNPIVSSQRRAQPCTRPCAANGCTVVSQSHSLSSLRVWVLNCTQLSLQSSLIPPTTHSVIHFSSSLASTPRASSTPASLNTLITKHYDAACRPTALPARP